MNTGKSQILMTGVGPTGRDLILALMADLYANGAGEEVLTLACKSFSENTLTLKYAEGVELCLLVSRRWRKTLDM